VKALSIRVTFEDEDVLVDVSDIESLKVAVEVPVSLALLDILSRVTVEVVSITEVSREDANLDLFGEQDEPRIHPFSLRQFHIRGA
jgi:hypothetical protein